MLTPSMNPRGLPATHDNADSSDVSIGDLEMLVEKHGTKIQRFCWSLVGDQDQSLDLTQDVFVIAIQKQRTFRGGSSVETWLLGIAVRVCRNWNRRQMIRRRVLSLFARGEDSHSNQPTANFDHADEIQKGLSAIDIKSRELLILRYFENRDVDELAEIMQVSRGAIEQRLSRARQKLAVWLERTK